MSLSSKSIYSSKNRTGRTAVLHLSPDAESGDPGREAVDLAVLTQRSGWRAVMASSGGNLVTEVERAAVRHIRMPLNRSGPFYSWRTRLHLEATVQIEQPTLLHAHGIDTLPFALSLSRSRGLPMVANLTQPVADKPRNKRLLTQLKSVRAMLRVPSEFMARHLHETFGVEEDRLCLVPPGVDLQWFSAGFISPERLQKISHLWRLPEQAAIVLVPMPYEPDMGHKVFLDVLQTMRNENIYAIFLGSDRHAPGLRNEIEAQIAAYDLNGKVITPENCPDLPAACWLANVIVAPNLAPRGQNLELLAAQAIGRPVIATDVGANPEMAQGGETAWVVKAGDVKAMAEALHEAVSMNTEQRLNLASATHDFIAEKFPQSAWFDGMMSLYDSLLHPLRQAPRADVA